MVLARASFGVGEIILVMPTQLQVNMILNAAYVIAPERDFEDHTTEIPAGTDLSSFASLSEAIDFLTDERDYFLGRSKVSDDFGTNSTSAQITQWNIELLKLCRQTTVDHCKTLIEFRRVMNSYSGISAGLIDSCNRGFQSSCEELARRQFISGLGLQAAFEKFDRPSKVPRIKALLEELVVFADRYLRLPFVSSILVGGGTATGVCGSCNSYQTICVWNHSTTDPKVVCGTYCPPGCTGSWPQYTGESIAVNKAAYQAFVETLKIDITNIVAEMKA